MLTRGETDRSDGSPPEDRSDRARSAGDEGLEGLESAVSAARSLRSSAFVRGFLFQQGLTATLACFQTETLQHPPGPAADEPVPGVYAEIQRLEEELRSGRREREEQRLAAAEAAEALRRLRAARELQRREHRRVAQERERLLAELRRLKGRCDRSQPALERMSDRYRAEKVKEQGQEPPSPQAT